MPMEYSILKHQLPEREESDPFLTDGLCAFVWTGSWVEATAVRVHGPGTRRCTERASTSVAELSSTLTGCSLPVTASIGKVFRQSKLRG